MAPKTVTERIALLACILVGCRAVIGVEDLHVAADGGPGLDAGADAVSTTDAGAEAATDAGTPPGDAAKPDLAACGEWCKTDGGLGDAAAAFNAEMKSCMCKGATPKACGSECPGLCPSGTPSSAACEACILQQALSTGGVCFANASGCTAECQSYTQCVQGCP